MKIGIIDTDHYFYIYSLIRLFGNGKNEITIYTTQKIFNRCKDDLQGRTDIKYVVADVNENWENFLNRNIDQVNSAGYSFFFILPVYHQYKAHYKFIKQLKSLNILVVFNLNGWIKPPLFKLRWFWNSWYKRKIINRIKWIAIDEHFQGHALKLGCKNNILHIPSSLYKPEYVAARNPEQRPLKFIVPGSIDKERRNYDVVLAAIHLVLKETNDFEVVFLGDPIAQYGKEIQLKAKHLNETYGKQIIKTYEKEYNDAEFEREIVSGHILITTVLPEFKLDGITEIYGISKSTGSCFDILAYAIPGVFPAWLSVNSKFNSSTLRFENENDLSKIMLDFIHHPEKAENLLREALKNSEYFSVDNVRARLFRSLHLFNNQSF